MESRNSSWKTNKQEGQIPRYTYPLCQHSYLFTRAYAYPLGKYIGYIAVLLLIWDYGMVHPCIPTQKFSGKRGLCASLSFTSVRSRTKKKLTWIPPRHEKKIVVRPSLPFPKVSNYFRTFEVKHRPEFSIYGLKWPRRPFLYKIVISMASSNLWGRGGRHLHKTEYLLILHQHLV